MKDVKWFGSIPVSIYHDDHEKHQYEDFMRVICPVVDEMFSISSNKGSLNIPCPGCGKELSGISNHE